MNTPLFIEITNNKFLNVNHIEVISILENETVEIKTANSVYRIPIENLINYFGLNEIRK